MSLYNFKDDPNFQAVLKRILAARPVVPAHNPEKDNTEVWKAKSAMQRGFDIWLSILKIDPQSIPPAGNEEKQ